MVFGSSWGVRYLALRALSNPPGPASLAVTRAYVVPLGTESLPRLVVHTTSRCFRTGDMSVMTSSVFARSRVYSSSSSSKGEGDDDDEGSHSDFATQYKAKGDQLSVNDVIDTDVSKNKVFVYMKGVPEAPQCGFSNMVCRILDAYEVEYGSRNVLEDPEIRQGIKDYTQWPTIPQVFMDGEFVGGCDILMEMHKSGELEDALK